VKIFEIIQKNLEDIILVKEDEIIQAMINFFERMKLVVEPSAATASAAVLKEKKGLKIKTWLLYFQEGRLIHRICLLKIIKCFIMFTILSKQKKKNL